MQKSQTIRKGLEANRANSQNHSLPRENTRSRSSEPAVRGTSTFTTNGGLIIPKDFANKVGKTAKEKRDLETTFVKAYGIFSDNIKKSKYWVANDVALSSSMLFINCLYNYSGKQLTQQQKDGIYKTFKNLYETDEYFQSLNNTERQKIYEMHGLLWAIEAVISDPARESRDSLRLKEAKDGAEVIFKHFAGVSIDRVRLKPEGFEIN